MKLFWFLTVDKKLADSRSFCAFPGLLLAVVYTPLTKIRKLYEEKCL